MRWTLNVNQKQSLCLGIKNINQSIILGLICECHSWAEAVLIDGQVFYWTSRQSFSKELPLLDLKADTIYRHLKTLEQLGLIEYKKDGKKDCVRLTKLGKSYYVGNESEFSENSEMNPNKLGNESENNSDLNPTYNNTNSYPITNNKSNRDIHTYSNDFLEFWDVYPNKVGKDKAQTAWKNKKNKPSIKFIIEAVERYKLSKTVRNGFTCNPATWINEGRWSDEVTLSDYEKAAIIQERTGMSPSETLDIQLANAQREWEEQGR